VKRTTIAALSAVAALGLTGCADAADTEVNLPDVDLPSIEPPDVNVPSIDVPETIGPTN
jgi:hypothetical protein